jgi:hypothetical protein
MIFERFFVRFFEKYLKVIVLKNVFANTNFLKSNVMKKVIKK